MKAQSHTPCRAVIIYHFVEDCQAASTEICAEDWLATGIVAPIIQLSEFKVSLGNLVTLCLRL